VEEPEKASLADRPPSMRVALAQDPFGFNGVLNDSDDISERGHGIRVNGDAVVGERSHSTVVILRCQQDAVEPNAATCLPSAEARVASHSEAQLWERLRS